MGFVGGGGNIAVATALPPSFCVLYLYQIVYGISKFYFFACLKLRFLSMWRLTLFLGVLFPLSADYSVVCSKWPGTLVT